MIGVGISMPRLRHSVKGSSHPDFYRLVKGALFSDQTVLSGGRRPNVW